MEGKRGGEQGRREEGWKEGQVLEREKEKPTACFKY